MKMTLKQSFFLARNSVVKHSPEILMGVGIVGVITATVWACKATTKLSKILEENRDTVDKINQVANDESVGDKYTEEDARNDLMITHVQTGVKILKLYAIPAAICFTSIGCLVGSHYILRNRLIGMTAAYATLNGTFSEYRKRVADRFGKTVEDEIKKGTHSEEITLTETDEDGTIREVKKVVDVLDTKNHSQYAVCFGELNPNWNKDSSLNKKWLIQQQNYCNNYLRGHGRMFLNEVYDLLGFPRTKAGQVVGWVYDPRNNTENDNYVDFGLTEVYKERVDAFNKGYEAAIWLDFNVDGDIWSSM